MESHFELFDLKDVDAWPPCLQEFLESHRELFLDYETHRHWWEQRERRIGELAELLKQFSVIGWHCTRLAEDEISDILRTGMSLPSRAMLHQRIDVRVSAGDISREIAERYRRCNQADDHSRSGRVWFCFFAPGIAGERGVGDFFRHWGGEALYNSHDGPSGGLQAIGTPTLIEAHLPIAWLRPSSSLPDKMVRRFLVAKGHRTCERLEHEDYIRRPLPSQHIRRVIRFPEPDFLELTGCGRWRQPLA